MRSNDMSTRQLLDAMDGIIARLGLKLDIMEAEAAGIDPSRISISPCMRCGAPACNHLDDEWRETLCRTCVTDAEREERVVAHYMPRRADKNARLHTITERSRNCHRHQMRHKTS